MTTLTTAAPGSKPAARPERSPNVSGTSPKPRPRPHTEENRRQRYELLRGSEANAAGHRLLAGLREALKLIDEFITAADNPADLYRAFLAAGFDPFNEADTFHARYFDDAAADASGFRWSSELALSVLECNLTLPPVKGVDRG